MLSKPQLKHLCEYITPSYAAQWRLLGLLLDVPLGILESIEYDYPRDCNECCNRMLTEWHSRDTDSNWKRIFDVIDSPAISTYYNVV